MKLDGCRWQDALDWQVRLWRWSQTDLAARYYSTFPLATDITHRPGAWRENPGAQIAGRMKMTMETGDPWWVSPDVAALVAEAAEDMPHDPLVQEDVPAPAGFVLIGGPPLLYPALEDGKKTGKVCSMRAMSWWTEWMQFGDTAEPEPALMLTHYAHIDDDDDFVWKVREVQAEARRHPEKLRAGSLNDLDPTGVTVLPFGDTSMWTPGIVDYSGDTRWTMAFFRFVQQRVVGAERQFYGRAMRRDALRQGFPRRPEDGYVTAIRLRRISRPQEEGYEPVPSGRTLTTRHIRSGHWRRQWYPSLQLHRPLYIHTTVVGPDGAPLQLRKARGVIVNR